MVKGAILTFAIKKIKRAHILFSPIIYVLAGLVLLNGCRVGPRYDSPSPQAPSEWKSQASDTTTTVPQVDYWWQVFGDPQLDSLQEQAVASNPNLYVALEKVMEARAIAMAEAASLYPQLNLYPEYSNIGMLFKPFIPANIFGTSSAIPPIGKIAPFRIHELQYFLPLNLSYEVDLWGKIRNQVDSAVYHAEAEAENYCAALLSLTADLASNYFQLRGYDAQIEFLQKTLETRQKNLELTQSRFSKGLVNYLDVTQAETDFFSVKAHLIDVQRLRTLSENQIAVLIGVPASCFQLEFNPLINPPPTVPPGMPSTVLLKRPDIAQAEREMASQHAQIGVAYASFFPALSLTGTIGFSSPDLSQFLKWISRYWMLGANSSQMIFDGGRDCANLQAAFARFREASGGYQQQVLVAFQEVENALNNIDLHAKQAEALMETVNSAKKATQLSKNRYVNGVSIYLEVVENERIELEAEINWVQVLSLQYVDTVQLIKALGESWEANGSADSTEFALDCPMCDAS